MSLDAIGDGLSSAQRRRAYLALASATFMSVIDAGIANVALPTIGREIAVTAALSIWIVNGYQLALVGALFTWSSFAQSRGLARTWRYGVVLFTLGSLFCSLAHVLPWLVAARVLQGLGAAGIMALSPAILRGIFPPAQLGRALGLNALVIATGMAAGPTVSGAILAVAPWPWLFLINVPIGLAVVLATRGILPSVAGHGAPLDVPSVVTSALGFALLVYGIDGFGHGEARPLVVVELLVGAVTFGWFLLHQRRLERPMFAVDLFARPLFALASLAGFLSFVASSLALVSLPFLFQIGMGATPVQSGLLMTPWPVAMGMTATVAGRLSDRYPAAILSTLGGGILALGLALYALLPAQASVWEIVLHGALCGFGFGLFQAPNTRSLMSNAPREQTAAAAAIMAASRVGGQTVGAAGVAVVLGAFSATLVHGPVAAAHAHAAVSTALWIAAGFAFVGAVASSLRFGFQPLGGALAAHAGQRPAS